MPATSVATARIREDLRGLSSIDTVHGARVEFAHGRDHGWAPYEPDTRLTMIFDHTSRIERDLLSVERRAWVEEQPLRTGCPERLLATVGVIRRLATERPRAQE